MSKVRDHGRRQVRDADARMTQDEGGTHVATFHPNGGTLHAQTDDDGNLYVFRSDGGKEDETMGDGEPDLHANLI